MKEKIWTYVWLVGFVLLTACSVSYTFNGASIDYTKVKTITIKDFPNQAPMVYPPLAQQFTEGLKDIYVRQTRLSMVRDNGDLEIEGEITGYDLAALAVQEDALSSRTKLTITVKVRYTNRTNSEEDFEQTSSVRRLSRSWPTRFTTRPSPIGSILYMYKQA